MALTPDDVVKKTFQPTKFREGYDQDEVDDFLDEVVGELRRLIAVSDDLREQLAACEARGGGQATSSAASPGAPASLQKSGAATDAQPAPAVVRPAAQSQSQGVRAEVPADPAATAEPAPAVATAPSTGNGDDPQAATGMLALAQRLHDEHVRTGEEQRDRLVAEARTRAEAMVSQAEERKTQTLGSLEQERSQLERRIDELRSFERDYRARLKAYLETQLRDLEAKAAVAAGGPGATGAGDGVVAGG
jgi:DivIVA domain-containing protein